MPYDVVKRGKQYCVVSPNKTHGCHDSRADAVKQQRALYKTAPPGEEAARAAKMMNDLVRAAPSGASVTMVPVTSVPVKDMALLRLAVKRSEKQSEQEVERAITIASGLADPEVAAQTIAVVGHLADRLRIAEENQLALVDIIQRLSADSSSARSDLLEALSGITERLAEAPQVNVTVPVPEVTVITEQAGKRVVELERDSAGRLVGATTGTRTIELERDSSGKLVGAVVEVEGADHDQEAA